MRPHFGAIMPVTGRQWSEELPPCCCSGYPVRVHKRRATVKFMFHTPDDIRWFRCVALNPAS